MAITTLAPLPPLTSRWVNPDGTPSQIWRQYLLAFDGLLRSVGAGGETLVDEVTILVGQVATLNTEVAALNTQMATLNTSVSALKAGHLNALPSAANDAAAATAGVPISGLYQNAGAVRIRLT